MKTSGPEEGLAVNDEIVGSTRAMLRHRGIKTISLVGPPRSGKTALLERTGSRLARHTHVGVLVGSPAAGQKSTRLGRHGICACRFRAANWMPRGFTRRFQCSISIRSNCS